MNYDRMAALAGSFLLLQGCATGPSEIAADELPLYGHDPLYHTMYSGSDEIFHYFRWNRGVRSGVYKVDRRDLALNGEFQRGTAPNRLVTRDEDGQVELLVLKPAGEG